MQAEKQNLLKDVQIDEQWISSSSKNQHMIDTNLLMCMVCYGIPLGQYAQCDQCGRIFCYRDFNQVVHTINACPNCKKSPFVKKAKPHILYFSLFQRIKFQCQLCKQKDDKSPLGEEQQIIQKGNLEFKDLSLIKQDSIKIYLKQQLYNHINDYHKANIMDFNILYDFEVQFDKESQRLVFDFYQNMQLNQKLFQYQNKTKDSKDKFPYQLDKGIYLMIDLKNELITNIHAQSTGKLIKKPSKTLQKQKQYQVWEIMLDYDFKYYSQKFQLLIQNQHKHFIANKRKNQFIMDIQDQRYRISFSKMQQINTYSGYQRPIRKTVIKFT